MLATPAFGAPRGRRFEDIIPVGGRITAVHVNRAEVVTAIWLEYERNDIRRSTPRRGSTRGTHEVLKLKSGERIIGIHGYGKGAIEELAVATNRRTKRFGPSGAQGSKPEAPWFEQLTKEQRERYTGIGITGRADTELRQIGLRIQVKDVR